MFQNRAYGSLSFRLCVSIVILQDIGRTALMYACFGGHTECVELLLSNHADPNIRNHVGNYCFEYAQTCTFYEILIFVTCMKGLIQRHTRTFL